MSSARERAAWSAPEVVGEEVVEAEALPLPVG